MKKNKLIVLGLTFLSLLSCTKDDDSPDPVIEEPGAYAEGLFVLNEGNFGSGNSSVTFVSEDLSEVSQDIFRSNNDGVGLGDTATDIGFYEDLAFIVVNVSNTIEIVDRDTWESLGTIDTNLENPRKIAFANGKAYVTNWGQGGDPDDDYVAVFNIEDLSLSSTIPVVEGPEEIISDGSRIYVAHAGGYSFNNKITVINPIKDMLLDVIEVGDIPNSMVVENGILWVASSGLPYYAEGGETAGTIAKIDLESMQVVEELNFSNATQHPANLTIYNGTLYYTLDKKVYQLNPRGSLAENAFLELTNVDVLYGFEIWDNKIFAASANSTFTGKGRLFVYDLNTKELVQTIDTGINPSGIFVNN